MDGEQLIFIDEIAINYTDELTVLEICNKNNISVPQMCSLEHLTPPGHCGLCTVEMYDDSIPEQWVPVLACMLAPQVGIKIRTQSKVIAMIREMAGKLILRSHPCDCDFCEKFGHCELQKIYNKTKFGFTRAIADGKEKKAVISCLSLRFCLDREKCTNCGACTTYCREELGEDFLHSVLNFDGQPRLELYPGVAYREGYLLNLIEICPYNAIIDRMSLGHHPSWKLQKFNGISTESSTGNNITIFVHGGEIAYIKPRKNPHIGDVIPDIARDLHHHNNFNRVDTLSLHGQKTEERETILFFLSKIGFKYRCAIVCNGSISLESMLLTRQLADVLGAQIFVKNHCQEGDNWLISSDKNTNIRSALVTQVIKKDAIEDFSVIEELIFNHQIQTLIIINEDILGLGFSKESFATINSITFSSHKNETTQNSHIVLPICTVFEEDGHFINKNFLLQRFHRAIIRETKARALWEWLAMIKNIYTGKTQIEFKSIENIWNFMEKSFPEFKNLKFSEVPPTGVFLESNYFKNFPFVA
ncbi:MAG: 2Fe-2S iron-sulfur cluster binding domain-containing protein [Puniceicoccales bacterium]|jgi:NADH dehydrogenase/NADH:ubiquinone oxidoreductase subunit G|nr:2Fe-2S iron-sulfur cluster binding domain-containing protein [Puniceicoccales bacterium]